MMTSWSPTGILHTRNVEAETHLFNIFSPRPRSHGELDPPAMLPYIIIYSTPSPLSLAGPDAA
jgi:hypothetical protein